MMSHKFFVSLLLSEACTRLSFRKKHPYAIWLQITEEVKAPILQDMNLNSSTLWGKTLAINGAKASVVLRLTSLCLITMLLIVLSF